MSDKKNIDQFFQEKFKEFESAPKEQVWKNIQIALEEKKKKRKIIPLWIKISGIAAALMLGLFALNTVYKTNPEIKNSIVLEPKNLQENKDSISNLIKEENHPFKIKKEGKIAVSETKKGNKDEKEITTSNGSKIKTGKEKNQNNPIVYLQENHPTVKSSRANDKAIKENILLAEKSNTTTTNLFEKTPNKGSENNNLKDKIEPKIALLETTKIPEIANELEEILKKKEEGKQALVDNQKSKWQITPNIAALYLNSNSGGSAIDPQFSENQKTSDNSLSFGIGVNYAISKKIAIRSGINKLSLGYNTNNIAYSAGLSNHNLPNISYSSNALIEIRNEAAYNSLMSFEKDLQKTNTGSLNQKMGYYELPLEISYAILDTKFGFNVIGGISTLFLNENKISLISSDSNVKLGEAKNLNQINFSTNVGVGFKYQFAKSFQFNFEPMLKYQLSTFSNSSGDFKPLFIGLYSGISYQF